MPTPASTSTSPPMHNYEATLGGATTPADAWAIRRTLEIAKVHEQHVVCRLKKSFMGGLFRPSYAIRVKLFLPFLAWLLAEVAEDLEPPVVEDDT